MSKAACFRRICPMGVMGKKSIYFNQGGLHRGVIVDESAFGGYKYIMGSLPSEIMLQIVWHI